MEGSILQDISRPIGHVQQKTYLGISLVSVCRAEKRAVKWVCVCDSVPDDQSSSVPADGSTGGPQHPCHYLGTQEQTPRLLSLVAQDQNTQDRSGNAAHCCYYYVYLYILMAEILLCILASYCFSVLAFCCFILYSLCASLWCNNK